MGIINPAHIHALKKMINQGGYFELLSMTVEKMELGLAELHVELNKNHLNPFGGVHGGVYSSVLDSAAYWDVYYDMPTLKLRKSSKNSI